MILPRFYINLLVLSISAIFDISYDINVIDDEKLNFFISSAGIELFTRIMGEYVMLEGKLDGKILLDIYSIFDEKYLLEVSNYLKPISMEYIATFLIFHSFKKNQYREQILNRAMGILMFSYDLYDPYDLLDVDSKEMWQEFSVNSKHIIHRFGNMDYTLFHQIADLGVQTLTKLAYADTNPSERTELNQFLLVEIFKENENFMQRTLDTSRIFLRSDKLEEKKFMFY